MLATRTELHLALTRTDLASPNTHAAPRAQSQPTPTPRAHSPATRAGPLTEAHQSTHPQPGPQGPGPRSDLSEPGAPQAPGPNLPPEAQTYTRSAAGGRRGLGAGSTGGSPGGGGLRDGASGGWRGSRGGSGGQRAPRPPARPAPAPRHPPAALAPARDSCTDMKRGPRTPKKPAPANQRRAPPSLRPPIGCARNSRSPGLPDGPAGLPPCACPPPPRALPAAPAADVPPRTRTPRADCAPPLADTLGSPNLRALFPVTNLQLGPLPGSLGRAPSGCLGVLSPGPQPFHSLGSHLLYH